MCRSCARNASGCGCPPPRVGICTARSRASSPGEKVRRLSTTKENSLRALSTTKSNSLRAVLRISGDTYSRFEYTNNARKIPFIGKRIAIHHEQVGLLACLQGADLIEQAAQA